MKKSISRRRFVQNTTTGGMALLALNAEAASPARHRLTGDEVTKGYAAQQAYEDLVRLPVYKTRIDPHWDAAGQRFWYRIEGPKGTREFIRVDAAKGTREPAFDHARLAAALGRATGQPVSAARLPFTTLAFTDDETAIRFTVGARHWECDLSAYTCVERPAPADEAPAEKKNEQADIPEERSPDGRWLAFLRETNVWLRDGAGGTERQLTRDGSRERPYCVPRWSPNGRVLAAFRIRPVPVEPVYLVESSPKDNGTRGVLHRHEYAQPGDPFPVYEAFLVDPETGATTAVAADPIDTGEEPPALNWRADSGGFLYEKPERGHQRFRIVYVDAHTGQSRPVVDEKTETFINTSNVYTYYPKSGAEVIYASEQDGWRHLYLYDTGAGTLKNRITAGEWVVRAVERVDEEKRQIWFRASGKNRGENPYHLHDYRVNFDGTGLVELTEGNGTHTVQYSPDRSYLIDTCSRPDLPPVHTLRRVADGSLVCPLETADVSGLVTAGWRAPEVFTAKGRDGKTDIWGLVFRPLHFDPKKRYPVIENIYAGPHDSFVRQSFAVQDGMQSLAELGFVVVQCDGMGTRNRSKAFHDVCWRNVRDAGLPDRIAWIKALGARDQAVDTTRVGIYGTSAGGQSSTGALLFHPEFYQVAVSSCGCHDNRIDKRWWNEQWMGYPVGPWYADNSNITHAANLRGKLLLLVGELDTNVPPESTIRLTDALMKADKDFELVIVTGADHTGGGVYGDRRRRDFFVRHLHGIEPPDRNAPKPPVVPVSLKSRPLDMEYLASASGGADTTVLFRNATEGEVKLYWLPGDGRRVPYGTVPAKGKRELHTYAGHCWLVTDRAEKPLALFVGESRPGIAEVHE